MRTAVRLLAATSLLVSMAGAASAATVDFNDNPDDQYFIGSTVSDGYLASAISPMGTNDSIDGSGPSNGTVHLDSWTNDSSTSAWSLSKIGGGVFSLSQFDFATPVDNYLGFFGTSASSLVTVTGFLFGGGTVSQDFSPVVGTFQTFVLNGSFTGLTSVQFTANGNNNRGAYDNIVVQDGAVPEAATWAMFIAGFGMVGAVARRRRVSVSFA